jgi:hypothetical protein
LSVIICPDQGPVKRECRSADVQIVRSPPQLREPKHPAHRLRKWQLPSGHYPSLCAPRIASRTTRPPSREPRPLSGYRRTRRPVAVVLRFSIHLPLRSTDFRQSLRYYEEIRLLLGHRAVVSTSFRPTVRTDPRRSLGVRTINVLPLPSPVPSWPRLDIGRRVPEHACRHQAGLTGLHLRSVLQFTSGFFPTRPRGAAQLPLAHSCLQQAL